MNITALRRMTELIETSTTISSMRQEGLAYFSVRLKHMLGIGTLGISCQLATLSYFRQRRMPEKPSSRCAR